MSWYYSITQKLNSNSAHLARSMLGLMWALRVQFDMESSIAAMTDSSARGNGFVVSWLRLPAGSGYSVTGRERGIAQAKGLIGGRNGSGLPCYSLSATCLLNENSPGRTHPEKGKQEKRKRGMGVIVPFRQTVTIGKEAMKKLRHFCADIEARPNDVIEAMILREDFDENGTSLLDYIEKNRNLTITEESP